MGERVLAWCEVVGLNVSESDLWVEGPLLARDQALQAELSGTIQKLTGKFLSPLMFDAVKVSEALYGIASQIEKAAEPPISEDFLYGIAFSTRRIADFMVRAAKISIEGTAPPVEATA